MTEATLCGGDAKPDDLHLLCRVVAIDSDIISVIAQRPRRRRRTEASEVPSAPD
jgi:hypothetical protein